MRPIDGVHNGDLRLSGDLTLAGAPTRDQDSLAVKTFIAIREARYLVMVTRLPRKKFAR